MCEGSADAWFGHVVVLVVHVVELFARVVAGIVKVEGKMGVHGGQDAEEGTISAPEFLSGSSGTNSESRSANEENIWDGSGV